MIGPKSTQTRVAGIITLDQMHPYILFSSNKISIKCVQASRTLLAYKTCFRGASCSCIAPWHHLASYTTFKYLWRTFEVTRSSETSLTLLTRRSKLMHWVATSVSLSLISIMNTFFEKKDIHKQVWQHPGTKPAMALHRLYKYETEPA